MSLLGVLGSSAGVVIVAVISWLGARRVQGSTADKNAVDGFDLLTGRLEARLTASEKREADLLTRVEHAEARAAAAESRAAAAEARVETLVRLLTAHGITEETP